MNPLVLRLVEVTSDNPAIPCFSSQEHIGCLTGIVTGGHECCLDFLPGYMLGLIVLWFRLPRLELPYFIA